MNNYGLSSYQINKAKDKLQFNKEFMSTNGIQIDDKIVPFSDFVSNSYMNSDRYIAELQHRAWSVYDYSKDKNLSNIFITLTLPSHWHKTKQISKHNKTRVFNKKFGGRKHIQVKTKQNKIYKFINAHATYKIPLLDVNLDFTNTIDKYTPRNASKELTRMFKKIFDDRAYKSIKKEYRCYFRVTEPHKSGTPHVHMSLFVPADKVESIVKSINRLFPAPLSKVETEVNSPVSYLMKYVLKTLDDLRDDNEKISNLTLWYLYHGISRFYTSRTFVSLDVYRKLNGMYTLIDLTKEYLHNDINVYLDTTTKKVVLIENEFGTIYTPKPINWHDKLLDTDHTYLESQYEPLSTKDMSHHEKIKVNDKIYIVEHTKLKAPPKYVKKPYDMRDSILLDYFNSLDIETADINHYSYTHKLISERGLGVSEWLKPYEILEANEVF